MSKINNAQLGFNFESNEIQTIEKIAEKEKETKKKEENEKKQKEKEVAAQKQKLDKAKTELKDNCKIAINYLDGKYDLTKIKVNTETEDTKVEDTEEENEEEEDE